MTKNTMRTKFILLFLAVGLVWTGAALALDVPDGDFETPALADGAWAYVNDIDGSAWTATIYGGGPGSGIITAMAACIRAWVIPEHSGLT